MRLGGSGYGPMQGQAKKLLEVEQVMSRATGRTATVESAGDNPADPWRVQRSVVTETADQTTAEYLQASSWYNVKEYGAKGDGTTNDTAAFQEAIDTATTAGGGTIWVPEGRYLLDPVTATIALRILLDKGAVLVANSLTNEKGVVSFEGSASGTTTTLSSSATRGDLSIAVSSASGFAAGDWIKIEDTGAVATDFEWEFARIRAVDGSTLRLTWPLEIPVTYPSGANGVVTKINMIEGAEFVGGEIDCNGLGGTNVSGVRLGYCVESRISGVKVYNFDYAGLDLQYTVQSVVDDVQILDSSGDLQVATPPDAGYGVLLRDGAAHTLITNSRFRQLRHGALVSQGAHHVAVTHCDFAGLFSTSVETHFRRALQIVFANNVISGDAYRSNSTFTTSAVSAGIQVATTDTTVAIVGNVVLNQRGIGIGVINNALTENYVIIADNVVTDCAEDSASSEGSIYVFKAAHVVVANNRVIRSDTVDWAGIRVGESEDVQLVGNEIVFTTSFSATNNRGFYIVNSKRVLLHANAVTYDGTAGQCYRVDSTASGDSDEITFVGNQANVTGGASAFLFSSNATNIRQTVNSWEPETGMSADRGDANVTLTMGDFATQRFATTLTANRTVTLPTAGLYNGAKFRVVRTGLGAFTLAVGTAKTIPNATAAFVDVEYDGSAWRLTGYGTL